MINAGSTSNPVSLNFGSEGITGIYEWNENVFKPTSL